MKFYLSRLARTCAALIPMLLLTASQGQAWGCKGHQTVALIAEKHLSPEAKALVEKLLSNNPVDPKLKRYCGDALHDAMADASTWPDDVRSEKKNGPWHYLDIPRGAPRGPVQSFCAEEGCVTRAIAEQAAILKDASADPARRADALRYVIHFVGDLHQPLHAITNADQGGNCVPIKYFRREPRERNHGYSPNLHALWDTAIPERDMEGADPAEYADILDATFAKDIETWARAGIHVDDWAWESHDYAETNVYAPLTPQIAVEPRVAVHTCADDHHIGDRLLRQHINAAAPYQDQASPIVEKRIAQAGLRLALILNDAAKTP